MVIYGIQFNANDYGWDETNDLADELYEDEVQITTGYSVSSYTPDFAVIGVTLSSEGCLFNPLNLIELYENANGKLADLCEKGVPSRIQELAKDHGIEGELELLIVDETDD